MDEKLLCNRFQVFCDVYQSLPRHIPQQKAESIASSRPKSIHEPKILPRFVISRSKEQEKVSKALSKLFSELVKDSKLTQIYRKFDRTKSQNVTFSDFCFQIHDSMHHNWNQKTLLMMFNEMDRDQDGVLKYQDFARTAVEARTGFLEQSKDVRSKSIVEERYPTLDGNGSSVEVNPFASLPGFDLRAHIASQQ